MAFNGSFHFMRTFKPFNKCFLFQHVTENVSDVYIAILSMHVESHSSGDSLQERNMLFEDRTIKWKHFHLDYFF